MKKFLAFAIVVSVILIACVKGTTNTGTTTTCTNVDTTSEDPAIQTFCNKDSVTFKRDVSGVYYHITDTGTGVSATSASVINFTYTATLLNGTILGSGAAQQAISGLIEGFQLMDSYLKLNTHIEMVIPSSLAYGCTGAGTVVPSNSVVSYDVIITAIE